MIQVNCPSFHTLGDKIDLLVYCHLLGEINNEDVFLNSPGLKHVDEIKNVLDLRRLTDNRNNQITLTQVTLKNIADHHILDEVFDQYPYFPITKKKIESLVSLPEKYITVQWDAGQGYRRLSKERHNQIIEFYRGHGYQPVVLTGSMSITQIGHYLQNAAYHVGVDSGMMNLAKYLLPTPRIHVYGELMTVRELHNKEITDHRFGGPDAICASPQLRRILKKGAKLNFIDTKEAVLFS